MNLKSTMVVGGLVGVFMFHSNTISAHASCPPSTLAWTETRLFFGRNIAGSAEVSAEQWRRFTTQEIIPRFGDGFTVLDASGYWRGEGCKPDDVETGGARLAGGCEKST